MNFGTTEASLYHPFESAPKTHRNDFTLQWYYCLVAFRPYFGDGQVELEICLSNSCPSDNTR